MSQIVSQTNGFDEVFVGAQGTRQRPANLSNFQRVGEAGAEVVAFVVDEDLRLVFESPKSGGVEDPVAVALERGAIFRLVIEISSPLRVLAA